MSGLNGSADLAVPIPAELVDAIAHRVADELAERMALGDATASPWLTLEEAAAYLRMPKDTLYKRTAEIPHTKQGGRIRFRREELDAWMEEGREGPISPGTNGSLRGVA